VSNRQVSFSANLCGHKTFDVLRSGAPCWSAAAGNTRPRLELLEAKQLWIHERRQNEYGVGGIEWRAERSTHDMRTDQGPVGVVLAGGDFIGVAGTLAKASLGKVFDLGKRGDTLEGDVHDALEDVTKTGLLTGNGS
jgi:hypothetical protein